MSRFLVAGFIQIETIVKVDKLPVPYSYFTSVPDMIHTDLGGAGYNAVSYKHLDVYKRQGLA